MREAEYIIYLHNHNVNNIMLLNTMILASNVSFVSFSRKKKKLLIKREKNYYLDYSIKKGQNKS